MFYTRALQVGLALILANDLLWLFDFRAGLLDLRPCIDWQKVNTTPASDTRRINAHLAGQAKILQRRHVGIATTFPYHAEVYGPFTWAIDKIFKKQVQPTSLHVYDKETEFFSLMKRLDQLSDKILRPQGKDTLLGDIRSTKLFPDDPGAMIDLVFLVTCERDLPQLGPDLLQAWDERSTDKKFMLVCGVHNGADPFWTHRNLTEWSKRGALRLLTISDHVAQFFKMRLNEWADSRDPAERLSFYEYVKTDVFYPVSDFSNFPLPDKSYDLDVPCTALIQGGFEKKRRDYDRMFLDLVRLLRDDPGAWGYSWSDVERQYLPDARAPNPPFVLHLLGWSREALNIPREIEKLVVEDIDFSAHEFYTLVQSMDIVIPAFSPEGGYLTLQASSTIHTALENHVPILATRAMWEAYPHIRGMPSILRPASLSEMEAIGLLRGAKISSESPDVNFSGLGSHTFGGDQSCVGPLEFCEDLQDMLQKGWKRAPKDWDQYLEGIWATNEVSAEKILLDM